MGHLVGKDLYRRLGRKIDNLHVRAPWNETFYQLIKALYSTEEADVVVKMPFRFSNLDRIANITKVGKSRLRTVLENLCEKGLVMDACLGDEIRYMPTPLFVGIFEFTMMRTDRNVDFNHVGSLFHYYMEEGAPYRANFGHGTKTSIARTVPHEEALGDHVEILDYERVSSLMDEADRYAVGFCSCRHTQEHIGEKQCDAPLDTCTTFGWASDYLVRHGMSRAISKMELQEIFARSRELGLIFSADNVRKGITFVCHCCGCCCAIMTGLNRHGLTSTTVTSSFIAQVDSDICTGCKQCVKACPVNAIEMAPVEITDSDGRRKSKAVIDESICLGCGVCALKCSTGAMKLDKREARVIHPETTFERVILQCLERGTLQNQIFDNPESITQDVLRYIVGAFLRLSPVKRALMSDALRSNFLNVMGSGAKMMGKELVQNLQEIPS